MKQDKFLLVNEWQSKYGKETQVLVTDNVHVTEGKLFTIVTTSTFGSILSGTMEVRTFSGNLISRHESKLPDEYTNRLNCTQDDVIRIKNINMNGNGLNMPCVVNVNDDYYVAECTVESYAGYGCFISRQEWGCKTRDLRELLPMMLKAAQRDVSIAGFKPTNPPFLDISVWLDHFTGFDGVFRKLDPVLAAEFMVIDEE